MEYQKLDPTPGAMVVEIPFPYKQFTDTAFFLTETSSGKNLFIPDDQYQRIDDTRIELLHYKELGLSEESEIRFTFIHQKNRRWIGKVEFHFTPEELGQREFQLPYSPYSAILNLNKRTYVFWNRKRQVQGLHYTLENTTGRIVMRNREFKGRLDDRIDVMVVYTGNSKNHAIQELPESGYIYLANTEIDRNYSNDRMAVFINGKLVDRENIIRISNGVYKVSEDIGSRYDLEVRSLSPRVNSLVPFYKRIVKPTDSPWQYELSDIISRIEVPDDRVIHGRRRELDATFNPVYFNPELLQQPNLWINLTHTKRTHLNKDATNLKYILRLYGDDYVNEPSRLYVVLQLRLRGERAFSKTSLTPVLVGFIDGTLTDMDEDRLIASTQVKTILNCDEYRAGLNVDGIIGRLQADPKRFDAEGPIYFSLNANRFEYDTRIGLWEWSVTSEPNNKGIVYWKKHIAIEPDNKMEIVAMKGDEIDGWTAS